MGKGDGAGDVKDMLLGCIMLVGAGAGKRANSCQRANSLTHHSIICLPPSMTTAAGALEVASSKRAMRNAMDAGETRNNSSIHGWKCSVSLRRDPPLRILVICLVDMPQAAPRAAALRSEANILSMMRGPVFGSCIPSLERESNNERGRRKKNPLIFRRGKHIMKRYDMMSR